MSSTVVIKRPTHRVHVSTSTHSIVVSGPRQKTQVLRLVRAGFTYADRTVRSVALTGLKAETVDPVTVIDLEYVAMQRAFKLTDLSGIDLTMEVFAFNEDVNVTEGVETAQVPETGAKFNFIIERTGLDACDESVKRVVDAEGLTPEAITVTAELIGFPDGRDCHVRGAFSELVSPTSLLVDGVSIEGAVGIHTQWNRTSRKREIVWTIPNRSARVIKYDPIISPYILPESEFPWGRVTLAALFLTVTVAGIIGVVIHERDGSKHKTKK
jgi:hypothetical protein